MTHSRISKTAAVFLFFMFLLPCPAQNGVPDPDPLRFQSEIDAFIAWDEKNSRLFTLDTVPPMLDADGQPDPGLLLEDGLHLNEKG